MTERSDWLIEGPDTAPRTIILAHGAGAPMDSEFMNVIAGELLERGLRVVRFEFPYMAATRHDGRKRPPDRQHVLLSSWRSVAQELGAPERLVIGGKSMGGRMASLVADELGVAGLVCLGYPFHPPGKPERTRIEHLQSIRTPTLILQGERDTFGGRQEVENYPLGRQVKVNWLADGDHSFRPRKRSGVTEVENLVEAANRLADFVEELH